MINTRALQALDLRRRGAIFENIGKEFGVSRARARQLVEIGHRIEYEQESGNVWYELSTRARNALITNGCKPTPAGVLAFTQAISLARVPNLGKKAIAEIHAWLTKHK